MKTNCNRGMGITSIDILGVNMLEMRQMSELNNRIKNVLDSHKENNEKKEYVSDDDLKQMRAILSVLTKDYSNTLSSAFDDELKAMQQEKPQEKPVEKPEEKSYVTL